MNRTGRGVALALAFVVAACAPGQETSARQNGESVASEPSVSAPTAVATTSPASLPTPLASVATALETLPDGPVVADGPTAIPLPTTLLPPIEATPAEATPAGVTPDAAPPAEATPAGVTPDAAPPAEATPAGVTPDAAPPAAVAPTSVPSSSQAALVANGGEVFTLNCARCHAESGQGTAQYSGLINVGSRYTSASMMAELTTGHRVTFGFADKLSEEELTAVVAYVKATFP